MIPEVEFVAEKIALLTDEALERVRQAARDSPRLRARLCLHASPAETLHEMIIVLRRGTVIPIHRHPAKAECYHLMHGLVTLCICDAEGRPVCEQPLGPIGSGRPAVCRIAEGLWHTVKVESEEVVLHESTTGPLGEGDTEYLARPAGGTS
jgi:cupin fold WbuC family metalloprotein